MRRCLKGVDSRSKEAPEFVAIDEQPNDEIVHALRLGKEGSGQNDVKMHAKAESQ
jgi:hypothetical protein